MVADVVTAVCLVLGAFLMLTGSVGLLRMPDFYSRLHPAGKNDSLGQVLVLVGLAFQVEDLAHNWMVLSKLGLIILFLIITAPTATHAITKAAWLEGLRPWRRAGDAQAQYDRPHAHHEPQPGDASGPDAEIEGDGEGEHV